MHKLALQVGGPLTDSMQNLSDEVAAWIGTGAAVISGSRALPVTSVYFGRPQVRNWIQLGFSPQPSSKASVASQQHPQHKSSSLCSLATYVLPTIVYLHSLARACKLALTPTRFEDVIALLYRCSSTNYVLSL